MLPVKWLPATAEDTMESYAKKMSAQIEAGEPFYLLGVSFGGMVCVEISNLIKTEKIFLISSCKSRNDLPWYFRMLKYIPVHLLFGDAFYKFLAKRSWKIFGIKKEDKELFYEMVDSPLKGYYRPAINYIINWQRKKTTDSLLHIHGNNDIILPHHFVHADKIIEGGTHAMIAYQAREIAELIEKNL